MLVRCYPPFTKGLPDLPVHEALNQEPWGIEPSNRLSAGQVVVPQGYIFLPIIQWQDHLVGLHLAAQLGQLPDDIFQVLSRFLQMKSSQQKHYQPKSTEQTGPDSYLT